jgi:L,D-peptidoglycan transpeptidase YkuD (ErfK/YbiS/YcfS/YnhG family)
MRTLSLLVLGAVFSLTAFAQVKTAPTPAVKVPFKDSLQAVVVTTKDWSATQGNARLFERKNSKSKWKSVGESFAVVVGRNGLVTTGEHITLSHDTMVVKKEGDGKSPAGLFPLTFAFGTAESIASKLSYSKLEGQTECVDDVNSQHYNRVVGRLQVGIFDWKSSEKMAAITPEYDLGVFVAYNSYPVEKDRGSCIFLHIWKDADSPTSGCTAMERVNLEKITAWLDPTKNPYLVQLPDDQYLIYGKSWNLPKLK